jgi:hypothetical protein
VVVGTIDMVIPHEHDSHEDTSALPAPALAPVPGYLALRPRGYSHEDTSALPAPALAPVPG